MAGAWEKRWHPLLGQWVIIASPSPDRPWSGATIDTETSVVPPHDEKCYLCPRVQRATGSTNPDYRGPFAFDNDFPSLSFEAPETADKNSNDESENENDLIHYAPAHGRCRVLCWSHRHDATLATVSESNMIEVAQLWQREFTELSQDSRIAQVSIFENKGTEIGVSNLHPHGQIYATDFVTDTVRKMRNAQAAYPKGQSQPSLLGAIVHKANQSRDLIVERTEHCTVLVPGCARFSFETWIVPHRQATSIAALTSEELCDFALAYQRQVKRYDTLFQRSAPNITLLYNAPVDEHADNAYWHFHLVFQPPLRDPLRLKYLAGFESGAGNIINPLQPEAAAARLRSVVID